MSLLRITSQFCVGTSLFRVGTSQFCVGTSLLSVVTSQFCVGASLLPPNYFWGVPTCPKLFLGHPKTFQTIFGTSQNVPKHFWDVPKCPKTFLGRPRQTTNGTTIGKNVLADVTHDIEHYKR